MLGEQGLIVGTVPGVGGAAANVGRQRYRAALLQGCEKRVTGAVERQHDRAVVVLGSDGGAESAREGEAVAGPQPLGGTGEGEPATGAEVAYQQRLDLATTGPRADQPGRDHLGVVEDQQVAAAQKTRQVAHRAVVQPLWGNVEQPCRVPRRGGPLCDEILGQLEVEEIDPHRVRSGRYP